MPQVQSASIDNIDCFEFVPCVGDSAILHYSSGGRTSSHHRGTLSVSVVILSEHLVKMTVDIEAIGGTDMGGRYEDLDDILLPLWQAERNIWGDTQSTES